MNKKTILIALGLALIPVITILMIAYRWYSSMTYTINNFEVKNDANGLFFNIGLKLSSSRTTPINLKGFKVEVYSGDQIIAESEPNDLKLTNDITYNIEKLRPILPASTTALGVSLYLKFKFKIMGIPFTIKKMI